MVRRVAKNTFFLSASQITARAIGFLYFIFLARMLGVETFGIYNFTLAFVYSFTPVADFGIERLVLRDISRKPEKTSFYLTRLLPLRFLLTIGAYFAALILGVVLGQSSRQILYLAIFGLYLLPCNLTYLIASFQNARERMGYMAVANVAAPILTAILGVPFALLGLPLGFVLSAVVVANLVIALFFLGRTSSWNLKLGWMIDRKFWCYAFFQSWPFAVLTILAVFYLRISLILVGLLKGAYFTGLYGSAFKFISATNLIPQSLALALFPLSSRLFTTDRKKLEGVYKKGLGVLLLFSLPFALFLAFASPAIIRMAYGSDYLEAAPILSVLGLALLLFFLNALPGNIILNSPKVRQFLPLALLNFLLAVILGLILIPRYSMLGAAWAVVGGELFGLIVNNWFVYRLLKT